MEIKEAIIEKRKLERVIQRCIDNFIETTGLYPTRIDFSMIDASTHDTEKYICGKVEVEVQLGG